MLGLIFFLLVFTIFVLFFVSGYNRILLQFLGLGSSSYYEKIETDTTASARQKKQEGDYWDTFLNIDLKLLGSRRNI